MTLTSFRQRPAGPTPGVHFLARLLRTCLFALAFVASHAGAVDLLVSNFTDSPDPATRGGRIAYSATITNNETDTATGVTLAFALDPNTSFDSVSDTARCSYAPGTHTVNCLYPAVRGDLSGAGSADVFTAVVTVTSKTGAGATVGATATVSSAQTDSNPSNNSLSQVTTIDNGADLALSLSGAPNPVLAGANLTYTAAVSNLGPNAAAATTVSLNLSPNVTYSSYSGNGWSCALAGQVLSCTRAFSAVGALPAISVVTKVTGAVSGTITTSGTVSTSGAASDFNPDNNTTTANVTVNPGADLAMSVGANTAKPEANAPVIFTLQPRNLGPFGASNVTVTDTLPAGFSGIGASGAGWSCGVSGQTVTCTRASYAVGASNNIAVTATTPDVATATGYTNTATIASSATPDPVSGNNSGSASVNVMPPGADLSITKSKGPNPVAQGGELTSTIRVTNNGPQGARAGEVSVRETLPAGETFASFSGSNWSCGAQVSQVVTCTYNAALALNGNSSNLLLKTTAGAAGTLTNEACAVYTDSVGAMLDANPDNNCRSASVSATATPNAIDLAISKTVDVDPLAWNATTLVYTVTVTNLVDAPATGVVMSDAIPGHIAGSTGVSAVRDAAASTASATFNCSNGATVSCSQTGGTIGRNETVVFRITVTRPLLDSGATKFTNTATVTSTDLGDVDTSNNSASVQVKVDPVADVHVSASATPVSTEAGTSVTYVFTVNNAGPSTASGITLSQVFDISAGTYTYLSHATGGGSCTWNNADTLNCSLNSLARNTTTTVTVVVRPDYMSSPPSTRTLTGAATVATTTKESNTANNTASASSAVIQAALDLLVNNSDSPDPLGFVPAGAGPTFPDNVVTFRNTITNRGPSVASSLVLTYRMTPPAGKSATFLGDKLTATGQSYSNYCNNVNAQATGAAPLTVTCAFPANFILLANNATTDLFLDFRVDSAPSATGDTFRSMVSIASSEPDTVASNNSIEQTTTVRMRSDLQLAKSARAWIGGADAAASTVQVRQPFYWVLTLTNAGPGDSQVTTIKDTLPAGVALYTPPAGAPGQYKTAPYSGGVSWSASNGASGACSGTTTLTCDIGVLESGKVAVVRVPVVSVTAGSRNNCASATTSEVDPNQANNTSICSSVTVQQSSLAGAVYHDADNNGARSGAEAGIGSVALTLAGADDYGNPVSLGATSAADGGFSFGALSPGSYTLSETHPVAWLDGIDKAGSAGGTPGAVGSDAISGIVLGGNTSASGYLFGEVAKASLSGYVFVDGNDNALRDAGEAAGIPGVTMTLTGADDLGAVSLNTTTAAVGLYTFANLRPGTYRIEQATIGGVTHTGMTIGSKGGSDGATVLAAGAAVRGQTKRAIDAVLLAGGDSATGYDFGESGQGLTGFVYADRNGNGVKDAGEVGIAGVAMTLSGSTSSGVSVCVAISPNPCTVLTGANGGYAFSGLPASDATGYTITEQAQNSSPLSGYGDGAERAGTLGGSTAANDAISGIVVALGQFGAGYDFGERAGSLAGRVYVDLDDDGALGTSDKGVAGVAITLSGRSAAGVDVCTILGSCSAVTGADGSYAFADLPAANAAGYTLVETQPRDYGERTTAAGGAGGAVGLSGANSQVAAILLGAGVAADGYLFGEKPGALSGYAYIDANNNGVRDAGELPLAGVAFTLSGQSADGFDVCTLAACGAVSGADGAYRFSGLPNAGAAGYTVTQQAQTLAPLATLLDGKVSKGTGCGSCTVSAGAPNAIAGIPVVAGSAFEHYDFGELRPAAIAGSVYVDTNRNGALDAGEALGGVALALSGVDDLGNPVGLTTTSGADGGYRFDTLRPSGPAGYTVLETQPAGYADFAGTLGSRAGSLGGTVAPNAVSGIVTASAAAGVNYDFREQGAALSGRVYMDYNDNGIVDTGETPLPGVTITLEGTDARGNAVRLVALSGADGSYRFTGLAGGSYTLTETQPGGVLDGRERAGSAGGTVDNSIFDHQAVHNAISAIALPAGADATGYDFGERPIPVPLTNNVSGRVYLDQNGNGRAEAQEPGIAGVTITLAGASRDGVRIERSVATGADGRFAFTDLPESGAEGYVLAQIQPAGYRDGQNSIMPGYPGRVAGGKPLAAGAADRIEALVLGQGMTLVNYDFGELPGLGSIAGRVYVDTNDNGVPDAGETGIAGVALALTGVDADGAAVRRDLVSGVDGSFRFTDLAPSNAQGYTLTETQPASHRDRKTTIAAGNPGAASAAKPLASGGADEIKGIVLAAGQQLDGYRFGEAPGLGAISGIVFADRDDDGARGANETGIGGVNLVLSGVDADGKAVRRETVSAADGGWRFADLAPSDAQGYTVTETQPDSHRDGKTIVPNGQPGKTGAKPVASGGADVIAGIVLAGQELGGYRFAELAVAGGRIAGSVYLDRNGNGLRENEETGMAGVTLLLSGRGRDGAAVERSAATGADGRFAFEGVPLSDAAGYRLAEVQPAMVADGRTTVTGGLSGAAQGAKPVGVGDHDVVTGIRIDDDTNADGYLFGEAAIPTLKPPIVNGYVWMDRGHNRVRPVDGSMQGLGGWTVELSQNERLVCRVQTDAEGFYQFDNLHCPGYEVDGLPTGSGFAITFSREGSTLPAVAQSGGNKGRVVASGGRITDITLRAGEQVVEQNLPLDPAGIVYDLVTRKPVAGAVVTIAGPAGFVAERHLVGAEAAVSQTVGSDGMYQFLLQNDFPTGVYTLSVAAPNGYLPGVSKELPACQGAPRVTLAPTPALVQRSDGAPALPVPLHRPETCAGIVAGGAESTQYYLGFLITNGGSAPILNNHIPLDPVASGGVVLTKTTPMVNVARGELVPYTITAANATDATLAGVVLRDRMPAGFKYRPGSARVDGVASEPKVDGRELSWPARTLAPRARLAVTLVLAVGAGVGEGEYVNQAEAVNALGAPLAPPATAAVRIVPDATFDCPDVIGKVFDDANANGYQDEGEMGLPAVRLATPRGLLVTTDAQGRYHVPCAELPDPDRGANFVMKLDERTLPSGYRVTTENPGVARVTRGKVTKLNFGAAIHRVVRIELSDAAFEEGGDGLRAQWQQQIDTMMEQLKKKPSVLRIAYQRGAAGEEAARRRVAALRDAVRARWKELGDAYPLAVEVEDVR
ncbi:SdrD B-like domain-containing protein [uncultured Massilia sp.]|uniref:SdrD B-like domain-containing protein n=1 Tax=uncultured Massilia sp. TaxID=169973 RepID=UPI0025911714|nr:SdrD B-like domain-containing protein [uncultured Massilia sp.]